MEQGSLFQPVYGSEESIQKEPIVPGQVLLSDAGKIYLDVDDTTRILMSDKAATFTFNQDTASTSWVIDHNLNKYPSLVVIDADGHELIGDVTYTSANSLTITFSVECSGTAYLN